jgi:SNF2 family DNA or RNA helicase
LFTFLRYIIVPSYKEWKKVWKRRMEAKSPLVRQKAFERFQAVLGIVLLRRAKHDKMDDGRPVIELPPRHVETIKLDFSKDELEFYTYLEKNTMAQLNNFSADGGGTPDYMSVLLLLLRLRQACSHPSLCSWSKNAGFVFTDEQLDNAADARTIKSLPTAVKERLMVELAPVAETQHTCPVCMDVIGGEDGVVTACGHIFCVSDFESWTQQNDTCPSCRAQLADVKNVAGLTQVRMEVHALFRKQAQAVADREGALKPAGVKMNGLVLSGSGKRRRCSDEGVGGKPAEKRAFIVPEENAKANPETTRRSPNVGMQISEDRRERRFVQTAKIKAFMNIMESMIEEGDKKALVFSQWTRMLDLVSVPLKERGISFEVRSSSFSCKPRTCFRSHPVSDFSTYLASSLSLSSVSTEPWMRDSAPLQLLRSRTARMSDCF